MHSRLLIIYFLSFIFLASVLQSQKKNGFIQSPIINGYYADPTIIKQDSIYYIYATIDPWGREELAVLVTKDFVHFDKKHINWPTKKVCTSPASGDAMVWAPSVVKAKDRKFICMFPSGAKYVPVSASIR
jgi:beta-xylosidase